MKDSATANFLPANAGPIHAAARRVAHRARAYGIMRSDLEQELFLHCFQQLERYDPARASLATFLARITANRALLLVGQASTAKRGGQSQTVSFEQLPERQREWPDHDWWATEDGMVMRIDVRRVLERLPPDCISFAGELAAGASPSEAGKAIGCSRATAYRRLAFLKREFEQAGLHPTRLG
ncbi:MAG: sigma-70 family RNA polymerase sigma factor [Acidobacteria bacterium]|nr:sigma-70 family RNA polymerase sigma factor [Acidobacteriota bacterium]